MVSGDPKVVSGDAMTLSTGFGCIERSFGSSSSGDDVSSGAMFSAFAIASSGEYTCRASFGKGVLLPAERGGWTFFADAPLSCKGCLSED